MNKPWMGYVSSVLLFLAGILMIIGDKLVVGIVFILLAIAGLVIKIKMNKKK